MDAFDSARDLYRRGKELIDETRDRAVLDDELRWAREDLEDALLDLKRGVTHFDAFLVLEEIDEVIELMAVIRSIIDDD
ncbi:MAG: hypothetical protein QM770_00190 [Tepidisphaeraceae bacterium]